jgi:hypothetical protein
LVQRTLGDIKILWLKRTKEEYIPVHIKCLLTFQAVQKNNRTLLKLNTGTNIQRMIMTNYQEAVKDLPKKKDVVDVSTRIISLKKLNFL